MYLTAMNKNQRGLLSWYNSGQKTEPYTVSLDRPIREGDDRTLLDMIPTEERSYVETFEMKEVEEQVYRQLINFQPENEEIWKKFIFSYQCDIENFTPEERIGFNNAIMELKGNKKLLGRIYDILKN
jgi:hypothetical protein